MNRRTTTCLTLTLALALGAPVAAHGTDLSWTALGGYQQGAGMRIFGTVAHFSASVPVGVQFGFGYAMVDPGNPALARHVFINNNTGGTPEESGHVWDLRADLVWMLGRVKWLDEVGVFFGPRYSVFTGRFRAVGDNEDWLVEQNVWGVGAGARAELKLNPRWSLAGAVGLDWYPYNSLYSHDATYTSTGTVINGRDDGAGRNYGWADADRAINQPKFVPSLLVGVAWRPY